MNENTQNTEHIPGIERLRSLASKELVLAPEQARAILYLTREGLSLEAVSLATKVSAKDVRALVTAVGRVLGQSLKHKEKASPEGLPTSRWTNGRGANPRSYAWVMRSSEEELEVALSKAVVNDAEEVTYEHYLDCWYAANSGWLNLADVVAKPRQARAYVLASEELQERIWWLRVGTAGVLRAVSKNEVTPEMLDWVSEVSWHIPAVTEGKYEAWRVSVNHLNQRKDLLLRQGLRSIKFEDLNNLFNVKAPSWVSERVAREGAGR